MPLFDSFENIILLSAFIEFAIASQNVIEVWVGGYLVICQIAQTYTGALLM